MVTKIRQYDFDKLPQELMGLDLEELETEFDGIKETADKLMDLPARDKYKDMNFDDVKSSYENVKSVKNRIKMMPKDSTGQVDLNNVNGLDFDGLK
jgi:hypothetical protein